MKGEIMTTSYRQLPPRTARKKATLEDNMEEGHKYLEEKLREKYSELKVGTTLHVPAIGQKQEIAAIEYVISHNTLQIITTNGDRASAKQIMKAVEAGMIKII